MSHKNHRYTRLAAAGLLAGLATSANAATMIWSTVAPTVDGADIASFAGATTDANNLGAGADAATYTANNQPNQGQTFTTGSNPGGYTLSAVTMQHVAYGGTFWSLDTGWNPFGGRFEISIGTISAGVLTDVGFETSPMVGSAPANQNNATGSGQYVTWTLDTTIILVPNAIYAFSIDSVADQFGGPFMEFSGIGTTSDSYTGGEAFSEDKGTNAVTNLTGDRVFHLDIAAVPEPSAALLGGLGMLALLRRRKR